MANDLEGHTGSAGSARYFVNYLKSKGNYFQDADGNTLLDLTANGDTLPLGYNHSALLKAAGTKKFDLAL